jgi:hypothetical protein
MVSNIFVLKLLCAFEKRGRDRESEQKRKGERGRGKERF